MKRRKDFSPEFKREAVRLMEISENSPLIWHESSSSDERGSGSPISKVRSRGNGTP